MSHTPHELAEDFPGAGAQIHALKLTNPHFAKLVESYHDLNRSVHRAETGLEPVDDFTAQKMRKERMVLKDEIAGMLAKAG
ncbi:YdcH family protein [Roseicyclus sp.]|uniref:YdcH family protein n=1 Tax=Roseicyclus sp. TaxID=1914329 RepID=UPI003F6D50DA